MQKRTVRKYLCRNLDTQILQLLKYMLYIVYLPSDFVIIKIYAVYSISTN